MGFVAGLVASHKDVCPWVSRNTVNYELCTWKRLGIYYEYPGAVLAITSLADIARADFDTVIANRAKWGRPAGTTDKRKKSYELSSLAAKNEITEIYDRNKRKAGKKRFPHGHLTSIILDAKKRNALLDQIVIEDSKLLWLSMLCTIVGIDIVDSKLWNRAMYVILVITVILHRI